MYDRESKPKRLIRLPTVVERVGLKKGAIEDRLNPASPRYDETFPKKVKIGKNSVAWLEEEVDFWIECQVERSRAN
ncbi:AlpA family phage regulatory protein [Pseudomonas putida]|uniref:helix-turn-helix transcriptional regulator n=1 Tax=Pseudomonas putida TaxID=303 RepID=UPI0018AC18C1|nr:AlpA family phage regulatory protein [Pseudomonas putida]MBF8651808.1 AlpA family phage regulatory protein [Pseudomonas putida]MBF8656189.1 AlpA family phage regulatory protein [Pseudomonas putida]